MKPRFVVQALACRPLAAGRAARLRCASATLIALMVMSPVAQACSVCFGKSDSALAKGMNMGIFTLLIFIGGVLGALACFFVFLAVRSSKLPHPDAMTASANSPDNPAHS